MSTGFFPQYPQYPQYQMAQPSASVGAVNIQIFNPTANASPMGGCCHCGGGMGMPYGPYNPYGAYGPQMNPAPPLYPTNNFYGNPGMMYPMNYNNNIYNSNGANGTNGAGNQQPKKTKTKVILTDEYIMSLENYLNNQDAKIRLTAAKELLERFKEDPKRKTDPALNALLNKVIQDPKASVRYVGLTALDTGIAFGNQETAAILNELKNRQDLVYGEDARLAAGILLKMSSQRVEVPDYSPDKTTVTVTKNVRENK